MKAAHRDGHRYEAVADGQNEEPDLQRIGNHRSREALLSFYPEMGVERFAVLDTALRILDEI